MTGDRLQPMLAIDPVRAARYQGADMQPTIASDALIVISALFAALGLLSGGNPVVAVIGLLAILGGGALNLASKSR
jgi:hypothetical protein